MTIRYLSEDEHTDRMAQAIYGCHLRRITLIRPWDKLPDPERDQYRQVARSAVAGVDAIREQALAAATSRGTTCI